MIEDFPAAHSMDTRFFAIDSAGCVAVFETGEAGVLPLISFSGDEAEEALQRLGKILPPTEACEDLLGRLTPPISGQSEHQSVTVSFSMILFMESHEPVRREIASGRVLVVPAAPPYVAVVWRDMTTAEHEQFHSAGHCRGCFWYFGSLTEEPDPEFTRIEPSRIGLYEYDHLTDNWISGPYGRTAAPSHPIHIDQLPPDIRSELQGSVSFSFRFADTPHIQPVEHEDCTAWNAAWLDSTGKHIRPIPDRREDYPEEYEQLREIGAFEDRYIIEPPEGEASQPEDDE